MAGSELGESGPGGAVESGLGLVNGRSRFVEERVAADLVFSDVDEGRMNVLQCVAVRAWR